MSSNDGTGLREALRDLRSFEYRRGDLIHQRDLGAKCMCAKCIESRADAALSAVAPPPVLEGMDAGEPQKVARMAWFRNKGPTTQAEFKAFDAGYAAALSAVAPPPVLERDGHVIRHVVEDGSRSEVIWRDGIRPGKGSHIYLHPEHAARLAASPAAPAQPEGGEAVLPCDVIVAPATRIKAGCKLSTLLHCIDTRRGVDLADPFPGADYEALAKLARPAPAQQAVTDEMRLNWLLARCTVDWSGVSIPCGLSRAGDPAESRAAIDAALASNAAKAAEGAK